MKETLLVDMDGTIADYEQGFLERWRKLYPGEIWIPPEQRATFYLEEQYPARLSKQVRAISRMEGFYRNLPTIPGGIDALVALSEIYDVRICTSPHTDYEHCVLEKYQWIDEHLGREWVRKIILTKDKTFVSGKYLIDDKPVITGLQTPVWEQIIYDQPYNRHRTDLKRITWQNWRELFNRSQPLAQEQMTG